MALISAAGQCAANSAALATRLYPFGQAYAAYRTIHTDGRDGSKSVIDAVRVVVNAALPEPALRRVVPEADRKP